jgi:molybdate transport system substrate-binding protein
MPLRIPRASFTGLLLTLILATGIPTGAGVAAFACDPASPAASPEALTTTSVPDVAFPDEGGTLTVFAAASLVDAFAEIESTLESAHPGLDIVVETAGSQTLVTQLREGARADVLATANTATMDDAAADGLLAGTAIPFTGNRLVIVAPAGNPAGIEDVADLANDGVHLVLAGQDVPAGSYAQAALCAYGGSEGASSSFLEDAWDNVVSEEQDVRSVLAKVQLGEADAGIVYASDAAGARRAGSDLTVIEFPASIPTTATYPIAPVAGGNVALANAFIGYVVSDEGQAILAEAGFSPVR